MRQDNTKRNRQPLLEGTVIVVSILLAFGIDAMWANHKEQLEEQEILKSLESEFAANLASVNRIIDAHIRFRGRVAALVMSTEEEIRALSQNEISAMMLATANPWTFDAVSGTADTLINGGKLSLLRDPRLRETLVTFMNRVADTDEDATYLSNGAEDLWRAEFKHGGPWTDSATEIGYIGMIEGLDFISKATADDLLNIRADPELMGISKRFQINASYYIAELQGIADLAEEILELIHESS